MVTGTFIGRLRLTCGEVWSGCLQVTDREDLESLSTSDVRDETFSPKTSSVFLHLFRVENDLPGETLRQTKKKPVKRDGLRRKKTEKMFSAGVVISF